jgi:hypothetical protein
MTARLRWLLVLVVFALGTWRFLVWLGVRYDKAEDLFGRGIYTEIEPGLFLGGQMHSPPPGTRAVLNLNDVEDTFTVDVARWEPIRDSVEAPDFEWLRKQIAFIDEQRAAGLPTFVHCSRGVSRSGFMMTAYYMARHGWTRDHALAFLRLKRPSVTPNPVFLERLLEWERECVNESSARD